MKRTKHKQNKMYFVIVFNWIIFEMRLLNLRIIFFFIYCGLFVLILGFFFFSSFTTMARGEIWPKCSERRNKQTKKQKQKKPTKMRTKSLQ